ncbi:hypothetical protein Goarm_009979, partial [Gossypium armourianum]|nr:hypothetical protein [Gossypium armourianum]
VDDVIQIEGVSTDAKDLYDLCLVGCFVTTSVVHFPVDIERVVKSAPWAFNNHLLVFHRLQGKEDPMLVSLVYFFFGVQVHDLPPGLFSKAVARQLDNFSGLFKEDSFYHIRLTREVNESDMEWDLSLWAVGSGILWVPLPTSTSGPINPILGINLEGLFLVRRRDLWGLAINKFWLVKTLYQRPPMGRSTGSNENSKLECSWRNGEFYHGIEVAADGTRGVMFGLFTWERGNFVENNIRQWLDRRVAIPVFLNLKPGGCWRSLARGKSTSFRIISLHKRVMDLNMVDRDDENLVELLDVKLDLNLEIDKTELFWEK